ncbi:hypothetical protein RHSIM_RhsimUnG0201300 [Rhododendron simsii]|uniref:Uncharacterized protein n=1 Tax=Rhododendron simsii TaxID=118357 RepID=A0A834L436_RHOSS|nr:hypothetical protein RHSIM_RhsimUnG0201300 [Rhododendron simsii]
MLLLGVYHLCSCDPVSGLVSDRHFFAATTTSSSAMMLKRGASTASAGCGDAGGPEALLPKLIHWANCSTPKSSTRLTTLSQNQVMDLLASSTSFFYVAMLLGYFSV